eukprot:67604_1
MPKLTKLPHKWQTAIKSTPQSKIPPVGGYKPDQTFAAWRGDKFLGSVAARILHQSKKQYTNHTATILTNKALSNAFFKDNIHTILPDLHYNVKGMSDHSIGTVVEIAVAEMFEADESAVEDLTKWLIQTAEDSTPDKNSKGLLLNLGGKVSSYWDGGNDHSPLFRAKAEFGAIVTKGKGKSKKKAEQDAAG